MTVPRPQPYGESFAYLLTITSVLYTYLYRVSNSLLLEWSRSQELNLDLLFRRGPFYPLNYSELAGPDGFEPPTFSFED